MATHFNGGGGAVSRTTTCLRPFWATARLRRKRERAGRLCAKSGPSSLALLKVRSRPIADLAVSDVRAPGCHGYDRLRPREDFETFVRTGHEVVPYLAIRRRGRAAVFRQHTRRRTAAARSSTSTPRGACHLRMTGASLVPAQSLPRACSPIARSPMPTSKAPTRRSSAIEPPSEFPCAVRRTARR